MSVIPEKELTLQYKQKDGDNLSDEELRKPSVADGKQIRLFVRNVKNIFQKEPNFIPKQRSPTNHNEGARTLVTDTVKANHKFEMEAYIYMSDNKGFSLPKKDENTEPGSSIVVAETKEDGTPKTDENGEKIFTAQPSKEDMVVDPKGPELDEFFFLGDTQIVQGSETIRVGGQNGTPLVRDEDYEIDYGRGRFRIKPETDNNQVEEDTVSKEIIPGFSTQVNQVNKIAGQSIDDDGTVPLNIEYDFIADPENVAQLIKRMSQLGGPVVMRKNKKDRLGKSGETGSVAHTIVPKKVEIVEKADKPDEVKVNIEARRASTTG